MSEYEELITQADIATAHVNWSKRVSDKERRRFWVECFANLVAAHEREKLTEREPFDMNDHPPHRLCECRKCMEYFTPLPDCDAFAASGKPIAEQTNTQLMEGYRIGLAEMREKCAKVVESGVLGHGECAAAIRAIKFEGDTGFRPVSEMIAEHKQDPKKAAAIEKAKMRKAKQEPVGYFAYDEEHDIWEELTGPNAPGATPLYAAPVRTKDLTDEEIYEAVENIIFDENFDINIARAVIAADREKNGGGA